MNQRMKSWWAGKGAAWVLTYILVPILVMVLFAGVIGKKAPEWGFFRQTVQNLDDSKETVMKMSGVALSTSVAITLLPSDYGNSIANELASMQKYFILILAVIFMERMIVISGIGIACRIVIPAACILWILSGLFDREDVRRIAKRIAVLAAAILLVVPISTRVSNAICADYLVYVDETIDETDEGVTSINDTMMEAPEGENVLDKISGLFATAIDGVKDLVNYFKDVIRKFVNSIAILIIADCLIPLLTLSAFTWLLKQLFGIQVSPMIIFDKIRSRKKRFGKGGDDAEEGVLYEA